MLGSDCGQTKLTIEPIPPNMLVLLDISTSMLEGLDGVACIEIPGLTTCPPSKISVASQSVNQMTIKYRDTIYWGLAMFPGDGNCGPPQNAIVPGPGNADMVSSRVAATTPMGRTPINAAIAYVQSSGYLMDPSRKNYLLLLSDGGESCNGDNANTTQRVKDMAGQGINTFVVGFGGAVDATTLNDFAVAGGVPNTAVAGTSYYQADSAAQLETALGSILARVVGCDFALTAPPMDPDKVWAFFDGVMVERNDPNGWTLDTAATKVTFVGDACVKLQSGSVKDVQVVFGCPQPVQG
jgi:hypothetical protein